jgi:hypothetical protein
LNPDSDQYIGNVSESAVFQVLPRAGRR